MSHRFTVSLEENDYGDTIITLPDTIIEELGLNIGDELDYDIIEDTLTFKKTPD
tara:strand:+ start:16 stop:177 length:162 start_codon:yes stop_codon:yes gene_type:complete